MKREKVVDVEMLSDDQVLVTFSDESVAILTGDELLRLAREVGKLTRVKGEV